MRLTGLTVAVHLVDLATGTLCAAAFGLKVYGSMAAVDVTGWPVLLIGLSLMLMGTRILRRAMSVEHASQTEQQMHVVILERLEQTQQMVAALEQQLGARHNGVTSLMPYRR